MSAWTDEVVALAAAQAAGALTPAQFAAAVAALGSPTAAPALPTAPAPPPFVVPTVAGQQIQIDPTYAPGTPDTVQVGGFVMSLPAAGEGILGYFQRTSKQTGSIPQDAGGLIMAADAIATSLGVSSRDQANWPAIVAAYAHTIDGAYNPGKVAGS
jgi:hypothetical protein